MAGFRLLGCITEVTYQRCNNQEAWRIKTVLPTGIGERELKSWLGSYHQIKCSTQTFRFICIAEVFVLFELYVAQLYSPVPLLFLYR
jgi:hypothetical protein